jgi:F420-dependent oxidoreductase-like protein
LLVWVDAAGAVCTVESRIGGANNVSNPRFGVSFALPNPVEALETIKRAEELGVPKVWITTATGADGLTLFSAAAVATSRIHLGTAIVLAWTRHPLTMAQQAADVAMLAPGRFTLGIGPGARITMERRFGLAYDRPLAFLREYVTVVKGALTGQRLDVAGERITVHGALPFGVDVPVIISALQPGAFTLAGEVADGALTWNCAAQYIRDVGAPAVARGAEQAGRPVPPIIGQAHICLSDNQEAVLAAAKSQLGFYANSPHYQAMFVKAGFPEAKDGIVTDRMIDALVFHGDEAAVARKIEDFVRVSGVDQFVLAVLTPAGGDRPESIERTLRLAAAL